jgi:hypothetical protein
MEVIYYDKAGEFERNIDIVNMIDNAKFKMGRIVNIPKRHKCHKQYIEVYMKFEEVVFKIAGDAKDYSEIMLKADWLSQVYPIEREAMDE